MTTEQQISVDMLTDFPIMLLAHGLDQAVQEKSAVQNGATFTPVAFGAWVEDKVLALRLDDDHVEINRLVSDTAIDVVLFKTVINYYSLGN